MVVLQARDKGGLTALFWAIRHDRLKAAVVLLDRGAHIDCKDRDGYTPLIWAASTGLWDYTYSVPMHNYAKTLDYFTQALLYAGCIHTYNILIYSYTYILPRLGRFDTMVLLLERGAGREERTTDGYTALIVAARLGRTDIVNLLLEEGADGRARDEFGKSAAYYARKEGRLAALQSLQKHVSAVRVPPTSPPSSPPFRRHKA